MSESKVIEISPHLLKKEGVYITQDNAKRRRLYFAWKREHKRAMDERDKTC